MFNLVNAIFLLLAMVTTTYAKEVCVEGFVMDQYCIDLGVLLDNQAFATLDNPDKHSIHCLVDVKRCEMTTFNVLLPNPGSGPKYGVALQLDSTGKSQIIELMRNQGICSTCKAGGTVTKGFRGTYFGEVDMSTSPATLKVRTVLQSPKTLNSSTTSDGCPNGADTLNITLMTDVGGFEKPSLAHASLMIIGWGLFLPTGVSAAHFLKHRPNALWFKMHRIIQVIGLIIAITGWIVALATFDVFSSKGPSFNHGALGMTVMVLGILQPINAFIRPHPPKEGESRPLKRLIWEIVHKCSGYLAILLALVTIIFGTFVISKEHGTTFRAIWGVTLAWVIIFSAASAYDGYRHKMGSGENKSYNMN